jgi:hypothetical protein
MLFCRDGMESVSGCLPIAKRMMQSRSYCRNLVALADRFSYTTAKLIEASSEVVDKVT